MVTSALLLRTAKHRFLKPNTRLRFKRKKAHCQVYENYQCSVYCQIHFMAESMCPFPKLQSNAVRATSVEDSKVPADAAPDDRGFLIKGPRQYGRLTQADRYDTLYPQPKSPMVYRVSLGPTGRVRTAHCNISTTSAISAFHVNSVTCIFQLLKLMRKKNKDL